MHLSFDSSNSATLCKWTSIPFRGGVKMTFRISWFKMGSAVAHMVVPRPQGTRFHPRSPHSCMSKCPWARHWTPQALHCSPLLLHHSGRVKGREEFPPLWDQYKCTLSYVIKGLRGRQQVGTFGEHFKRGRSHLQLCPCVPSGGRPRLFCHVLRLVLVLLTVTATAHVSPVCE